MPGDGPEVVAREAGRPRPDPAETGAPVDRHALRSAMARRFNFVFRRFEKRFFGHFSLDPEVVARLKALEARGSVLYMMRYSSRLDYFLFNVLFLRHGLRLSSFANAIGFYYYRPLVELIPIAFRLKRGRPREVEHEADRATVRRVVEQGRSAFLFLRTQLLKNFLASRKSDKRRDELDLIGEVVAATTEQGGGREVFLVPLAIFWKKGPRAENRFLNVDYGSLTRPSDFAKVARFVLTYRSLAVKVGDAIDVAAFVRSDGEADPAVAARKIRRAILIHLYREEKVVEGPVLRPRWRVLREVLSDPGLRAAMQLRSTSGRSSPEKVEREVEALFREISANMSSTWLAFGAAVVGGLLRRLFASVDVRRLAEIAEDAKRNPIVLVPSHRSYFDFLILSWLFYQNYLVPPHIAARENMAFGPFGFLFRHMGAFFLRRSFADPLYKEVFRAYVTYLVREGLTQEFFIEGGRSRTGKMLSPRLGMLSWEVDAFLESRRRDLFFVPIAINYERLVEESGMVDELGGGRKTEESVIGLLRARKYLQRRFGSVHVSFGEPISLAGALGRDRQAFEALVRGQIDEPEVRSELEARKREFVKGLGHSLVERIGLAMVANATSVAALVLLGGQRTGMLRDELVAGVNEVVELLRLKGVRLTAAFEHDLPDFRDSIAFLEKSELIRSRLDHRGEIVYFEEKNRVALDLYRNAIAHFFVIPSILARATLAGIDASRVGETLDLWVDLFYREYYASREIVLSRGEAVLEHFESEGFVERRDGVWRATARGRRPLATFAEQTRGVVEAYETLVRVVLAWMASSPQGVLRSGLLREARLAYENARLLGRVRRLEVQSDVTFDNALGWLVGRGVLAASAFQTGRRGAQDVRYARGEKWHDLESIAAILAAALRDG
ncbi:MAG: 1-acyl-sn-glycerol-3-phosphate acyltransferase [Myxococcota bacterium]